MRELVEAVNARLPGP